MRVSSTLAQCATIVGAVGLQIPLFWKPSQAPLDHPNGTKPLINSTELQDLISGDRLYARAKKLFEIAKLGEDEYNHPTRVIGSAGHLGTLSYIYEQILQLGDYYQLSNQSFPAVSGNIFQYRLVIGNDVPKSAYPMSLTPPTRDKEPVYGNLALVKNQGCQSTDFPPEVAGNIAFIERGLCPFGTKSENAGRAGAIAAIVYDNQNGSSPFGGTLGTPSPYHVATFSLSKDEATPYLKKLAKNKPVDAIAFIDSEVKTILTINIIAQTTSGSASNIVMLGAHSDSVASGPGINDDGTGTLSLLEVATQLTKFSLHNAVRFAWWAGEEEGLLGSDYYVATLPRAENEKIRMFMDYDMMGSPNFAYQVYNATNARNPVGSQELRDLYVGWYEGQGLNYTFIPFDGRSDYDGFIRNGIPGGGIATGAEGVKSKVEKEMFGGREGEWYDPCYHQLCDDVGNVNVSAWVVNTKLIAHSVATYAESLEGFPKRRVDEVRMEGGYEEETKFHGAKMFW
ncbi:Zn-dependent exopeptidase [Polyplosphaeria fusca]|uniref:Peptide hydrolase n=1 Tax=Polyplosphaeria fusca TaxID=682080 RepID=A0A9P4QNE9_9PLEO|nr:Zn-dependent exopeptidase [Polyplosphaeria fusca]